MAFWDSIGKAARGAYYQINPFDRGLTYSDSFRSGEERKRKQQQQAPRPQQPQNTQYVSGLVSGGGVKAQEDRRREVARQAARQQVQNPIGGFLAGVLNKGKSVAEDYVDLNKKGLDLLKDPQKILDGGEIARKAIVNATPPVQLYNRVRTAQRVQQNRQEVDQAEQRINKQLKEASGGQIGDLTSAIKTLSARRSELSPEAKKTLLSLLDINRQLAGARQQTEEVNLQNVDPVGILEDALFPGGKPIADLAREFTTRGGARIVKELDSNKLGKAMIPFIGETSKGIDVAQESSLGKFIFGRGKVDKASDDIKSFTKDIPILRDIFKYAPLATAGGIAINMPGIGGTKAGKFVKASKELSKVDNADDVIKVIGKYDDLTKAFGGVDDTLKPALLERLVKETRPKEIKKAIQEASEASKSLQFTDDILRTAKSSSSVSEFAGKLTDETAQAIIKASKNRAKTPEANIIADLLKTGEITPKSEELFSNLKAVVENQDITQKPVAGSLKDLDTTITRPTQDFSGVDETIEGLKNLDADQAKLVDDLAKQAGFAGLDDVARTLQPRAVSNIDESAPKDLRWAPRQGKAPVKLRDTSINPDDPFNNRSIINRIRNEAGELVDDDANMLKLLRKAEKETGQKGLVDQWMFDSGNIRSSASIANAKIRNSEELKGAFSGLDKRGLSDFDEYVGARAELKNYDGLRTSRPQEELQAIVQAGDATFGKRFEALNQYYKSMAQDMYNGGLISKQQLDNYLASDDYIRIQRDMEDLLNGGVGGSKARSLGSTTANQKRKGSSRDILSPSKTALNRTQQIQLEVQRNKAATNIISTLEELGIAERVDDTTSKNTISRLVDGERQIYQVPRDIKEVIDNVEPYRLGVIAKIVSAPTRLFRAGTTALSAPFTMTNYLRDQASSAIYSKNVIATHNPKNIIAGIGSATRDTFGESRSSLWKQFEEFAGDQTIFDELRNAKSANRQLREVRLGNKGKYGNMATAPIRTLEDLNSITERATRFQNFKGIYEKSIASGKNVDEALRDAVLAARQNSVDFQRSSSFTRVMNLFVPYFNASVQGSRNVARSFRDRPVSTSMKSVGLLAAPLVAVTAYNMSDDKRREAYNSINDFEKENNIIIVGPDAKQRDDGSWEGIYKIPRPQGYRELTDPVREITEAFMGGQPVESVAEITKDMLGGLTGPVNIQDGKKLVGSFIPQMAKPWVQLGMNQDLYTGSKIVPDFMVEGTDDPTKRAYEGSSGTARLIAEQLGVSPIQVEKAITDTAGSLGRYGINASDNLLSKIGVIGDEEIGGRSIKSDFSRRVGEASGELLDKNKSAGRRYYESRERAIEGMNLNKNELAAYNSLHPDKTNFLGEDIFDENKRVAKYTRAGAYLQFPKTFEVDKKVDAEQRAQGKPGNPLFDLEGTQLNKVLLKQALPPGASDPELDNLWKEEWYQDYQNNNSKYYDAIAKNLAKEGKSLPKSKNPYPETPDRLQKVMDTYSALPKGTGARSAWIRANPGLFKQMTDQWAKVDAWENKERVKLGLKELTDEDKDTGGYSRSYGGYGYGSGGGKSGKTAKEKRVPLSSLTSYIRGLGTDIPDVSSQIRAPEVRLNLPRPVASRAKRVKINFRG